MTSLKDKDIDVIEDYGVVCNPCYTKMFAVMVKRGDFWQQVGPRYAYKKNAEKAMLKLLQA